jgi:hypothetical protein
VAKNKKGSFVVFVIKKGKKDSKKKKEGNKIFFVFHLENLKQTKTQRQNIFVIFVFEKKQELN